MYDFKHRFLCYLLLFASSKYGNQYPGAIQLVHILEQSVLLGSGILYAYTLTLYPTLAANKAVNNPTMPDPKTPTHF